MKHIEEMEVARLMAMSVKDEFGKMNLERKHGLLMLERAGNFGHNCQIIQAKTGELILARRPDYDIFVSYKDFGPCPYCYGFMLKKNLWHHVNFTCPQKTVKSSSPGNVKISKKEVKGSSWALLAGAQLGPVMEGGELFKSQIIGKLKNDEIGELCKTDVIIVMFAQLLFEKCQRQKAEYVRCKMRELARLLHAMKKTSMEDILKPPLFDEMMTSIQLLCVSDQVEGLKQFGIPSLALKLGHSIRKCCNIIRGRALRLNDIKKSSEMQNFLTLMELEFNSRVSSTAVATLQRKKIAKQELLPLTSDLMKVNALLKEETKELITSGAIRCKFESYKRLQILTLAKITLFNKKRSAEASHMTLSQYATRPRWDDCSEELKGEYECSKHAIL